MTKKIASLVVLLLGMVLACFAEEAWTMVWSDEFNTRGLPDKSKWSYDIGGNGWGNNELQYYSDSRSENARIEDSVLIIELRKENFSGKDYSSARLVTKNKGDWLYGKFEVRAKIPRGKGTWPAIWMLPKDWEYGGWPSSGEIDIMEHVGYDHGKIHATVHTESFNHTLGTQVGKNTQVENCSDEFHVYSVEWYEDHIDAFVDGQKYFTFNNDNGDYKSWPFNKPFHLLLNFAFGGNWGGAEGIDAELTSAQFLIDYVRVYERVENKTIKLSNMVSVNSLKSSSTYLMLKGSTQQRAFNLMGKVIGAKNTHLSKVPNGIYVIPNATHHDEKNNVR